jgi:hypothetical protein
MDESPATLLQLLGAAGFGAILGWYLYYVNRYRSADVRLADLITVVGILGGGAISALFKPRSDLFGAYGLGLCVGFFGYFLVLVILVALSENFTLDWFLDGRRKRPVEPYYIPAEMKSPPLPALEARGDSPIN